MRLTVRTLHSRVDQVRREVTRRLGELPEPAQAEAGDLRARTGHILTHRPKKKYGSAGPGLGPVDAA